MSRFAVLPSIPLDPQNENDLVTTAIQKIYAASNGRLNDFSSASVLRSLIEGQVFAQGEFLKYLNSLPDAFVLEWLATVLGIQRKIGSPSTVTLQVELTRELPTQFVLPKGFIVRTSYGIGENVSFATDEELIIPPGRIYSEISATSTEIGKKTNVPANSLTRFEESLAFLRGIKNPLGAIGGSDSESIYEVRQRAYSLMTRRLPVTSNDWNEFFKDILGLDLIVKTTTTNTLDLNFWFLDRNGEPLGESTLDTLQNLARANVQVPIQVHVDNLNIQNIDLKVDIGATSSNILAQRIRNFFAESLVPNVNFSVDDITQVQDIGALFAQNYGLFDPNLNSIEAYSDPVGINPINGKKWVSQSTYLEDELIVTENNEFYRVENPFTPLGGLLPNNYPDLIFKRAKPFVPGTFYKAGDIIVDVETYGSYYVTNDFLSSQFMLNDIIVSGSLLQPLRIASSVPDLAATPDLWKGRVVTDGSAVKIYLDPDNLHPNPESSTIVHVPSDFATINNLKLLVPWNYIIGQNFPKDTIIFPNFQNFTSFASIYAEEISIFDAQFQFYIAGENVSIVDTSTIQIAVGQGNLSLVPTILAFTSSTNYVAGDYITQGGNYYYVLNNFTSTNTLENEVNVKQVGIFQTNNDRLLLNRYKARFNKTDYISYGNNIYQALQSFTPQDETIEELLNRGIIANTPYVVQEDNGPLKTILSLGEITIQRPQNTINYELEFENSDAIIRVYFTNGNLTDYEIVSGGTGHVVGQQIKSLQSTQVGNITYILDKKFSLYVDAHSGGVITDLNTGLNALPRLVQEKHVVDAVSETGTGGTIRINLIEQTNKTRYKCSFLEIVNPGNGYKLDNLLSVSVYGGVLPFEIIEISPNYFPLLYFPLREISINEPFLIGLTEYVSIREFSPAKIGIEIYRNQKEIRETGIVYGQKPSQMTQITNFTPLEIQIEEASKTYFSSGSTNTLPWTSGVPGISNLENSFYGVNFNRPVVVSGIEITQSLIPGRRSGFKVQASNSLNDSWSTIIDSYNRTDQVQSFVFRPVIAQYWRIISANNAPLALFEWELTGLEFSFEGLQAPVININPYEDIITDGNSLYRVMRHFTPMPNESVREAELRGDILKIVERYVGSDIIAEVKANSVLSLGRCEINFNKKDSYVFEKARFGENAAISYDPINKQSVKTNYRTGTILF